MATLKYKYLYPQSNEPPNTPVALRPFPKFNTPSPSPNACLGAQAMDRQVGKSSHPLSPPCFRPVGVLVVGLMPFLGLRTYPAFAMFSGHALSAPPPIRACFIERRLGTATGNIFDLFRPSNVLKSKFEVLLIDCFRSSVYFELFLFFPFGVKFSSSDFHYLPYHYPRPDRLPSFIRANNPFCSRAQMFVITFAQKKVMFNRPVMNFALVVMGTAHGANLRVEGCASNHLSGTSCGPIPSSWVWPRCKLASPLCTQFSVWEFRLPFALVDNYHFSSRDMTYSLHQGFPFWPRFYSGILLTDPPTVRPPGPLPPPPAPAGRRVHWGLRGGSRHRHPGSPGFPSVSHPQSEFSPIEHIFNKVISQTLCRSHISPIIWIFLTSSSNNVPPKD